MRERAGLSGALVLFFLLGYLGVGWTADPARAASLATRLDSGIPFLLGSIVLYWSVLPLALLPIFVVRDADRFRRVALAYALAIAVSLVCFAAFPVTSLGFRPDASAYQSEGFAGWLLRLTATVDPPMNLFPSLHLALATLATLAAASVWPALGRAVAAWTACIALAVCTTKQHFAVDALAGVALALPLHLAWVRGGRRSFGARGFALFGALVAAFYAALYAGYALGVAPWRWGIG